MVSAVRGGTPALLCGKRCLGSLARVRERPEGSTDPSGGFKLSLVSDAWVNFEMLVCLVYASQRHAPARYPSLGC